MADREKAVLSLRECTLRLEALERLVEKRPLLEV